MKLLSKLTIYGALLSTISSCGYFIQKIDNGPKAIIKDDALPLSIVFSHNINGETHPCGCRHFPLGGLPQVAGTIENIKKNANILYVDTGDTFFPTSNIPKSIQKSKMYSAKSLAKGLSQIGLKYMVPGDQDFAMGLDFLNEISKENSFDYLIANAVENKVLHKKWIKFQSLNKTIFMTGVVEPSIMRQAQQYFTPVVPALQKVISEFKKNGLDEKNKNHVVILLSHSGVDFDENIAEKFPQFDWIIGAHSQSFFKFPNIENKSKLVQVLSRNHYLGEIKISPNQESYQIHEVRDEQAKHLKNNPFFAYIDKHKKEVQKVQINEQNIFLGVGNVVHKYDSAKSCKECHEEQGEFWERTPHSIAYGTLIKSNEHYNTECLKCHTNGLFDERGFSATKEIVQFDESIKNKNDHQKKYWKEVTKAFLPVQSIRELSKEKVQKISKEWDTLDEKFKVTHNFANVQCLNCHETHQDHPFNTKTDVTNSKDQRRDKIRSKCLSCHDPDQSPQLYSEDSKGLKRKLNKSEFNKVFKKLSCPISEDS